MIAPQRLENLHSGSLERGRWSSLSSVTSGADRHTRMLNELIESSSVSSVSRTTIQLRQSVPAQNPQTQQIQCNQYMSIKL